MKNKKWILPAIFYVGAVVIYFLVSLISLIVYKVNIPPYEEIELENCVLESVKMLDEGGALNKSNKFVSTDSDPRIIYSSDSKFKAYSLVFDASSDRPIGDMVLYYKSNEAETYLEKNKIWAKELPDGTWFFDLKGKKYETLRLDPDSVGTVIWTVNKLTINTPLPLSYFFLPDAVDILYLLILPGLLYAIIKEMFSVFTPFAKKS